MQVDCTAVCRGSVWKGGGAKEYIHCDNCSPLYHEQTLGAVIRDVCSWKVCVDFGFRTQMVLITGSDNSIILFCIFFAFGFRPSAIKLILLFSIHFHPHLPIYDRYFPNI
jgi:hypothetical protein